MRDGQPRPNEGDRGWGDGWAVYRDNIPLDSNWTAKAKRGHEQGGWEIGEMGELSTEMVFHS